METKIVLPKLNKNMKHGVIVNWCKKPGDAFCDGEPLYEVETDKVVCEIEAMGNGLVKSIYYDIGSVVNVGAEVMCVEMGGVPNG